MVRNSHAIARDIRDAYSVPESERSPGGGHGSLLQYSCLENPTDRGDWQAMERDTSEATQHILTKFVNKQISYNLLLTTERKISLNI